MDIRRTDLCEPEVISLLELHHREMMQFSPPGTAHVLDIGSLRQADIEVFAAWRGTDLLAIGALRWHEQFAEIKSMRAHPDARGTGAGKAMLTHLIEAAKCMGVGEVKLETGTGELFAAANGLYCSFGFERCDAFAGYEPTDFNIFYALKV